MSIGLNLPQLLHLIRKKAVMLFSRSPDLVPPKRDDCFDDIPEPPWISRSEIRTATKNFDTQSTIGVEDQFWKLYQGTLLNGVKVAVKRFERDDHYWAELAALSKMWCPNVVSLIGVCADGPLKILVHEYPEKGTLSHNLREGFFSQPEYTWERRLQICIDIAGAIHHLHTAGSYLRPIHGNIKSSNIFLGENYSAKVADMAAPVSVHLDLHDDVVPRDFVYVDPLSLPDGQLTQKSDVYSFGVVLLEVLSGIWRLEFKTRGKQNWRLSHWEIPLLKNGDPSDIVDPVLKGKINPSSLGAFSQIVGKCLSSDRDERPVIHEIIWSLEFALELQET